MNESETSQRLTTALRKDCKCIIFKIHGHGMQQPGIPDFYIATGKVEAWIETKGPTTVLTPLQHIVIGQLKRHNVRVFVLRFEKERTFVFEDEEGNMLAQYSFTTWKNCAEQFLIVLHTLCGVGEFTCGAGTVKIVPHST